MLIEKLKQHLIYTSLSKLKEEWKLVEQYANIGPIAIDLVQSWEQTYLDKFRPCINLVLKDQNEITIETPNYSEFFFNIVLWKRKQPQQHLA